MRKCLFLDRDGVINHDPGDYTKSLEEFELLPTVIPTLQSLCKRGFEVIVITNQGGVPKGLYSKADVDEINRFLMRTFRENGIGLLDIFCSFHHDQIGASLDRKPDSLMLERAIYLHNVDVSRSVMVGDKDRDIQAGKKVGLRGVKVPTNGSLECLKELLK